ncbi:MAG: non-canonical purine NTP pyrophosphatase, partial [Maritimibacter sp.]|nr:non-canonical purine NTP pyrophosphatase [Maritimibacter sp.]
VFLPDGETVTFGEMDPARKHAMSHRVRVFVKLVETCFG